MATGSLKNERRRTVAGMVTADSRGICIVDGQMNGYEESGLTRKWPTVSVSVHLTQTFILVTVTNNFKSMLTLNFICLQ
jgi:hypothetical protein